MRKKVLLIGLGSIGKRLAKHFLENDTLVYTFHHRKGLSHINKTTPVTSLNTDVDAVIIAPPTSEHFAYLDKFAGRCPIFVEKPFAMKMDRSTEDILRKIKRSKFFVMTGFQMRFVPVISKITRLLKQKKLGKILHASLYVGQYLPFWRPNSIYEDSYSAKYERGGGVALDLIHEIDLAFEWFGQMKNVSIVSKRLGDLKINTENFVKIATNTAPYIEITLDSLNHNKTRIYTIIGEKGSIAVDMYHNHMEITDKHGKTKRFYNPSFFDVSQGYKNEVVFFLDNLNRKPPKNLKRFLGIDALTIAQKARKRYV